MSDDGSMSLLRWPETDTSRPEVPAVAGEVLMPVASVIHNKAAYDMARLTVAPTLAAAAVTQSAILQQRMVSTFAEIVGGNKRVIQSIADPEIREEVARFAVVTRGMTKQIFAGYYETTATKMDGILCETEPLPVLVPRRRPGLLDRLFGY